MKKVFSLILVIGWALSLSAQSTTVSATITDTDTFAWKTGTYSFTLVPNPNFPTSTYAWDGGTLMTPITGSLNSSGAFSQSVPSSNHITPAGSKWQIQICPNATSGCFQYITLVTGTTLNLTSTLSALAIGPRFSNNGTAYGYGTIEISGIAKPGVVFFDTTADACYISNGSTWASCGGGGGDLSGTLTAGTYPIASAAHTLVDGVIKETGGEFGITAAIDDDVSITARGDNNGYAYYSACNSDGVTCSSFEFDPPIQGGSMTFGANGADPAIILNVKGQATFQETLHGQVAAGPAPTSSAGVVVTRSINNFGQISGLTTATSVTITFASGGFPIAAFCVANASTSLATAPYVSAISNTAVTFTFSSLTGSIFYRCDGI